MSGIRIGGLRWKRELVVSPDGDNGELKLEVHNLEGNGGSQEITLGWVQVTALSRYLEAKKQLFDAGDWPKVAELGGPDVVIHRLMAGFGPEGDQREDPVMPINDPDSLTGLELDEAGCCVHCGAPAVGDQD